MSNHGIKMYKMEKIALVSGASSGIGKATAIALSNAGYDLIITGRRYSLLKETEGKILSQCPDRNVMVLQLDVREQLETERAIKGLPPEWKKIDVLVNNAGLAVGLNPIQDGIIDDWERMIDTNIKGLLYLSKAVIPLMVERGKGHIVNIGSVAGKEVYLAGNVYCATKHAVDALTKGMRIDLLKHNIRVTGICPGNVDTEFSNVRFKGDDERAKQVYEGYTPLYAEDVAEAILFSVTRPHHVNINDMLIMSTAQANTSHLYRKG